MVTTVLYTGATSHNTYTAPTHGINEHTHTHIHQHTHIHTHTHSLAHTHANIRTYIKHFKYLNFAKLRFFTNYIDLHNNNYQSPSVCNLCMFVCPPTNSQQTDTERELINGQYNFRAFIC